MTDDSTRQWGRVAEVVIGKRGIGVAISDSRIQFDISKTVESTPNAGVIRIFNLSPTNEARIKTEYDEIFLKAGYGENAQLIFRGNIKHVYRYRDGNDFITEIEAADGDKDFRKSTLNATMAAGTTTAQLVSNAIGSFVGGTTAGAIQIPHKALRRGKVVSGNTRDILAGVASISGANWSIQDGQLTMISVNGVAPGTAVLVNSETGMLGSPEINDKGIAVKCLLNPKIRVNGAIQLDNNSIKAKRQQAQALGKAVEAEKAPVRIDPDGIYKVIKITHKGDTRGKDWTSEITCIGLDQPIPKTTTAPVGYD